jgi:hypothetical protein
MDMSEPFFADGIVDIGIVGGIVRVDFFVLARDREAVTKPGEAPVLQRVRTGTLAMPLAGFVGAMRVFDEFRGRLVAEGVIKPTAEQPAPVPVQAP